MNDKIHINSIIARKRMLVEYF